MTNLLILLSVACNNSNELLNPFEGKSDMRDKIVIISDIHLGSDLSYSETVANITRLKTFLADIAKSHSVKELVIAGDLVDEWFLPSRIDTYAGGTQQEFVEKIYIANKEVFGQINKIIKGGKIKVTYVPGNHDLLIDSNYIEQIMPGINQARDEGKTGIGTYYPASDMGIAIEHCHRYDFFCALSPYSNQEKAKDNVLPPGYFFTRIAANSLTNHPKGGEATKIADLPVPKEGENEEQMNLYAYHAIWKRVLTDVIPVKDKFEDKIISTHINHFSDTIAINDILPYMSDNKIAVDLFDGIFTQQQWNERLKYNNVGVMSEIREAMIGSLETQFLDNQAAAQYFLNNEDSLKSNIRIVVFGHTHIPKLDTIKNSKEQNCIYVNSGCWIDSKQSTFVVIEPDKSSMSAILYEYDKDGKYNIKEQASL